MANFHTKRGYLYTEQIGLRVEEALKQDLDRLKQSPVDVPEEIREAIRERVKVLKEKLAAS